MEKRNQGEEGRETDLPLSCQRYTLRVGTDKCTVGIQLTFSLCTHIQAEDVSANVQTYRWSEIRQGPNVQTYRWSEIREGPNVQTYRWFEIAPTGARRSGHIP